MNGYILSDAIRIVLKAGGQIDAMVDIIDTQMEKMLNEFNDAGLRVSLDEKKGRDDNDWLLINWLNYYEIIEKKKNKPSAQIVIHISLDCECFSSNSKWQPTVFVMYAPGEDPFGLDSLSLIMEELGCVSDENQQLCRWDELDSGELDSWMFALPLVSINNEEDINNKIISPAKALLEDKHLKPYDCENNDFLSFEWNNGSLSVVYE